MLWHLRMYLNGGKERLITFIRIAAINRTKPLRHVMSYREIGRHIDDLTSTVTDLRNVQLQSIITGREGSNEQNPLQFCTRKILVL